MARDLFQEAGISISTGEGRDLFAEAGIQFEPKKRRGAGDVLSDAGTAVWEGAKSTARTVGAAGNTFGGDLADVEDYALRQQLAQEKRPEAVKALTAEIERRKQANPQGGVLDAIRDVGGAMIDNPEGTAQSVIEQAPNSAVVLGAGWAGAKLGAAGGAMLGPVGAVVGGIGGFLGGMFLGNTLLETGGKSIEKAEGGFTEAERGEAIREGAVKGGVITAVDAATLGAGNVLSKSLGRAAINAGARAEAQVLADAGVDITSRAAIETALAKNPALREAAKSAGMAAAKAASTMGSKAAMAGTGLTMETVGEGTGEYLGELAATGKADVYDAVMEAAAGFSQSAPEVAWNMRQASGNDLNARNIQRQGAGLTSAQPTVPAQAPAVPPNTAPPATPPASDPTTRLAELEIINEQRDLTPAEREEAAKLLATLSQDDALAEAGASPAPAAREVDPIQQELDYIDTRLNAITPANGYGPVFDQEREELAARRRELLEQQRATQAQPATTAAEASGPGAPGVGGEFADLFDEQGRPKFSSAQSVKDFKKRTGLGQDGVRAIQAAVQEGRAITVDEARQADIAAQERRNAALAQSKAESESEAQKAKENSAKPAEPRTLLGDFEIRGIEGTTNRVRVFRQGGRTEAVGLDEGTANSDLTRLIQAGKSVEEALATLYGDHGPNEAPNPGLVKRAGQPAPTDFWSFAKSKGYKPGDIKVGTPEHAALKAEYDALRQGQTAERPPVEPLNNLPDPALQNRDRSRAASVVQMGDIARNPDYLRLGPSRTPDSGAPMVFAVGDDVSRIPAENFGRQDVAVMSDGQRVPFRYAVVDASQVNPSNFADGRQNPEFASTAPGTIKALNNGRTAGVRAAYELGTAGQYAQDLAADEALHGIPAEVIARTPNPMLVRVYSERDNTADMAAKSQSQALGLSPAELARQDAPLLDTTVLSVYEPGEITSAANRDFVRAFVGKLQTAGLDVAGMMQGNGELSQDGRKRIQAALMQAAYGDVDLVEEMFDSTDTDIKAIGEALKAVAGQWANMRDSARLGAINPQVDVTENLVQAVNLIRKARRERMSLKDLVAQPDLMTGETPDALTVGMLRVFYDGQNFTRAVGRDKVVARLEDYIRAAMATTADAGLFGGEPVSPADILATIIGQGALDAQTQPEEGRGEPAGGGDSGGRAGEARPAGEQPGADRGGRASAEDRGAEPGQDAAPEAQQQVSQGDQSGQEGAGAGQVGAAGGQQGGAEGQAGGLTATGQSPLGAAPTKAERKAKGEGVKAKPVEAASDQPAIDREKLDKDFRTFPTLILNNLLERGEASKLYKAAGTKGASAFEGLAMDDKAAAYVKFVEQGGKPVESLPKDYNAWVRGQERDIEVRRLQSERVVRQENGKPFKTKTSAQQFQERYDLTGTHEVKEANGGFELRQLSPAAQAELKRKAEGRESYTEAQAAVAAEMGIGQTPDGEWDVTDEQFDELERRTQARMRDEAARTEPQRQAITPDDAGNMKAGDVVVDDQGVEYMALRARHKWMDVAPIVNGKPQVSADTTIRFHLNPETADAYPNRRSEAIYATGRNLYEHDAAPSLPKMTPERAQAAPAAEAATDVEQQSAIERHGLPEGTTFSRGKGMASGKWIARAGDTQGNLSATIDEAASSLAQFLQLEKRREENTAAMVALSKKVADKLRRGEQPTDAELRDLFGLDPRHTYVKQSAVGQFLVDYMGVPRNKIRASLGAAAGDVISDGGVKYPVVYPRKLHQVFGTTEAADDAQAGDKQAAAPAPAVPYADNDPFAGMKLPGDLKEYLLKPSVTLKDGKTISAKEFIDGLLNDGYGNPEYFSAPKGSQAGFLTKPGSPKVTLNDKQMFYADAAFMAKKKAGKPTDTGPKEGDTKPAADGGQADPQKAADRALFQSVIDGTVADILAPELADDLEAAYTRNQGDAELVALFEQAVAAYQAAMMAATSSLA